MWHIIGTDIPWKKSWIFLPVALGKHGKCKINKQIIKKFLLLLPLQQSSFQSAIKRHKTLWAKGKVSTEILDFFNASLLLEVRS